MVAAKISKRQHQVAASVGCADAIVDAVIESEAAIVLDDDVPAIVAGIEALEMAISAMMSGDDVR